jgi:hypothetical protein
MFVKPEDKIVWDKYLTESEMIEYASLEEKIAYYRGLEKKTHRQFMKEHMRSFGLVLRDGAVNGTSYMPYPFEIDLMKKAWKAYEIVNIRGLNRIRKSIFKKGFELHFKEIKKDDA